MSLLAADVENVAFAAAAGIIWGLLALAFGMLWRGSLVLFVAMTLFGDYAMLRDYQHGIRKPPIHEIFAFLGWNAPGRCRPLRSCK